jgi:phosphate transport system substrate-binding protein
MKIPHFFLFLAVILLLSACNRKPRVTRFDTMNSGVASVVCEDCFSPIIQEEIAVFEGLNPEAKIIPLYTDEVTAMNLLLRDSIRTVIAARDLTMPEIKHLQDKQLNPRSKVIAVDGIALIINKGNVDSLINVETLKKIITGEIRNWNEINPKSRLGKIHVVFDNPNSSTVRFIKDSVCETRPISADVRALQKNTEVIDYVSRTSNALGIIGVSWISNPKDSTNLSFNQKIRVMAVSPYDEAREDNCYKPFAAYIAMKQYPLTRNIYMITSDLVGGLPSGFMHFVAGDKGQRVILKCGLVPGNRPARLVTVKSEF